MTEDDMSTRQLAFYQSRADLHRAWAGLSSDVMTWPWTEEGNNRRREAGRRSAPVGLWQVINDALSIIEPDYRSEISAPGIPRAITTDQGQGQTRTELPENVNNTSKTHMKMDL